MGKEEKGGMGGGGVLSQYPISHLLPQELEWAMKAVIAFSLYLNLLLLWPGQSHWLQMSLIFVYLNLQLLSSYHERLEVHLILRSFGNSCIIAWMHSQNALLV